MTPLRIMRDAATRATTATSPMRNRFRNQGPRPPPCNSSPGLEGIEKTTGKDVAGMVIAYIEKNAAPGKTRTKGRG